MKQVICKTFSKDFDVLELVEKPTPVPEAGQVLVRLTSIGMNHAELMARRGEYKIASGDPPFTPGLEGGGIVEAVGDGVTSVKPGDRVVLGPELPRLGGPRQPGSELAGAEGCYRTHYIAPEDGVWLAPDNLPDEQLGTVWLPYLTAWGCLVWKQRLHEADRPMMVALPAASSSVALAAAQIVKAMPQGHTVIGLTTSKEKVAQLEALETAKFDHLVLTRDENKQDLPWHRDLKQITDGQGVDVFFDPVAGGKYLEAEIRSLATGGVVWIYGLLARERELMVTALIRKQAAIRGWAMNELVGKGREVYGKGCEAVLKGFADGVYHQTFAGSFPFEQVQEAHRAMEKGNHIGKLALIP